MRLGGGRWQNPGAVASSATAVYLGLGPVESAYHGVVWPESNGD